MGVIHDFVAPAAVNISGFYFFSGHDLVNILLKKQWIIWDEGFEKIVTNILETN